MLKTYKKLSYRPFLRKSKKSSNIGKKRQKTQNLSKHSKKLKKTQKISKINEKS
jgi:hypothetical protein